MAPVILQLLPPHSLYCEPFVGGGAIFFGKPPSEVEVINDTNQMVTNFYEQCKSNFAALQEMVQSTLYSRRAHEQAKVMYDYPELFTPLQKAWAL